MSKLWTPEGELQRMSDMWKVWPKGPRPHGGRLSQRNQMLKLPITCNIYEREKKMMKVKFRKKHFQKQGRWVHSATTIKMNTEFLSVAVATRTKRLAQIPRTAKKNNNTQLKSNQKSLQQTPIPLPKISMEDPQSPTGMSAVKIKSHTSPICPPALKNR